MRFKLHKGNDVLAGYASTIQEAQEQCDINKGWYYKLPKDTNRQELIQHVRWLCVNKQLESFGVTYTDVKESGSHAHHYIGFVEKKKFLGLIPYTTHKHKKVIWYQYYTFKTEEEFNNWKKFCIETFRKYLKLSKEKAESEFSWFNLAVGLKQEYLHERNTD